LGLVTGLRHSMEANYVAALSTIVASGQNKLRHTPLLGLFFGLGHAATLFSATADSAALGSKHT
jgi:high-affinity nickel permease